MDTIINREMVIKYRRHLIPLFLFPTVFFCGGLLLPEKLAPAILVPLFFAVTIYGAIPYFTKRASYNYWILAMGVWMCGLILALPAAAITRLFTGAH